MRVVSKTSWNRMLKPGTPPITLLRHPPFGVGVPNLPGAVLSLRSRIDSISLWTGGRFLRLESQAQANLLPKQDKEVGVKSLLSEAPGLPLDPSLARGKCPKGNAKAASKAVRLEQRNPYSIQIGAIKWAGAETGLSELRENQNPAASAEPTAEEPLTENQRLSGKQRFEGEVEERKDLPGLVTGIAGQPLTRIEWKSWAVRREKRFRARKSEWCLTGLINYHRGLFV